MRTKPFYQLVLVCFALLLGGVNQAWAQTTEKSPAPSATNVNNANAVTATWSFELGTEGQTATIAGTDISPLISWKSPR